MGAGVPGGVDSTRTGPKPGRLRPAQRVDAPTSARNMLEPTFRIGVMATDRDDPGPGW